MIIRNIIIIVIITVIDFFLLLFALEIKEHFQYSIKKGEKYVSYEDEKIGGGLHFLKKNHDKKSDQVYLEEKKNRKKPKHSGMKLKEVMKKVKLS